MPFFIPPLATGDVPIGVILPYGGSASPLGWLVCDGTAISRTTYASLFTVIGTSFGPGDGFSTFNLPDLRQRLPIGNFGGLNIGQATGSYNHNHTTPAHSHVVDSHNHTTPAHAHAVNAHNHTTPNHSHTVLAHNHSTPAHSHTIPVATFENHYHYNGMIRAATGIPSRIAMASYGETATAGGDLLTDAVPPAAFIYFSGTTPINPMAQHTDNGHGNATSATVSDGASSTGNASPNTDVSGSGTSGDSSPNTNVSGASTSGNSSPNTDVSGASTSGNNNPPVLAVNFIIKF